jgi:hypothetical protein
MHTRHNTMTYTHAKILVSAIERELS